MTTQQYNIFIAIALLILIAWNIARTLWGICNNKWLWYELFNIFELGIYLLILTKL
jgi:hypothetical protein